MALTSESNLQRLVNHVLDSAEQIVTRFEEGLSVVMTGKLPGDEAHSSRTADPRDGTDEILMEMDEDMIGSPLEGIADGLLSDIMKKNVGPQTIMENMDAFRCAIRWGEPFIISLIVFQIAMLSVCLWACRKGRDMFSRIAILLLVGILVRCAEVANGYGGRNWESFATQNYFDRGGIFVGIFFCGPLLLYAFMMLILLLREASNLLIEVKQMEIKKKRHAEKSEKGGSRGKKSKESSKKED